MKRIIYSLLILGTALVCSGCARVYFAPDAANLAATHRTIAIMPADITIAPHRRLTPELMKEQQKAESVSFQRELHSWMLRRKMQGHLSQNMKDLESTQAILQRAGYPETRYTITELCEMLEVDGIMTSSYHLTKPMSDGAAIAIGLLVGFWGATNEVSANLAIYHCGDGDLLWTYNRKYSGSVGSSTQRLVDRLMRDASRRLPYTR